MPAKSAARISGEETFCHIYNFGIENRAIFNEDRDYLVFLDFLKEYLSAPIDPNSHKQTFTIKGRTFKGVPHQPNNYFSKVELLAYSLSANHFHLLLHQKTAGSVERFIRSLCTRYSMYFNKKYSHSGALFHGPYKSAQLDSPAELVFLSQYIHKCSQNKNGSISSYFDYLKQKQTPWVKSDTVLSHFSQAKVSSLKGVNSYKDFVEKYKLTDQDKGLLAEIILESPISEAVSEPHLERSVPSGNQSVITAKVPVVFPSRAFPAKKLPHYRRFPEIAAMAAVLLFLVAISIKNIYASVPKAVKPLATPIVSGVSTTISEPTSSPTAVPEPVEIKPKLVVKITDGSLSVNIRQKPATYSEKIGEANDGDVFEIISQNSKWYEIKLNENLVGFISAKYAKNQEEVN